MSRPAGTPSRAPGNGALAALDLLASAVLLVGADGRIRYANAAAEHLLDSSRKALARLKLPALFVNGTELARLCEQALAHNYADLRQDLTLERSGREPLHVHSIVSASGEGEVVIELRENVQQLKLDREERILDQSQVNKELIRNLAHEIKNPLGGIRGAAQLLEMEVESRALTEYTQVIIKEADRLQAQQNAVTVAMKEENAAPPAMPPARLPGRNEPCWCGSGNKFKRCHGSL